MAEMPLTITSRVLIERDRFVTEHRREPNQVWLGDDEYREALSELLSRSAYALHVADPTGNAFTVFGMRVRRCHEPSRILCGIDADVIDDDQFAKIEDAPPAPVRHRAMQLTGKIG